MPSVDLADLSELAERTASSVETIMDSLYKTETAVINASASNAQSMRKEFLTLKKAFRDEWDEIIAFFRSSHGFDEHFHLMIGALVSPNRKVCEELMGEMLAEAMNRLNESKQLVSRHLEVRKAFEKSKSYFKNILEKSAPKASISTGRRPAPPPPRRDVRRRGGTRNTSETPSTTRILDQQVVEFARENYTRTFVEANLAAARPDGLQALNTSHSSLDQLGTALAEIEAFWEAAKGVCDSFWKVLRSSGETGSIAKQARSSSDKWKAYQIGLDKAIASITRSCDAVLIAPPSQRTETPRGRQNPNVVPQAPRARSRSPGTHGATPLCGLLSILLCWKR